MSKRHQKSRLVVQELDFDQNTYAMDFDLYEAPRGKKPKGKAKRRQASHKTAYYD